jgi:antitoxin VapB
MAARKLAAFLFALNGRIGAMNGRKEPYAMGLNIKNEEANRLAHELARATGESLTTAVTVAVRERLERLEQHSVGPLSDRLLKIGRDCAAHLREPFLTVEHGELLYDEQGLPK